MAVGIYGFLRHSMHGNMSVDQLATNPYVEPNTTTRSTVLASPASLGRVEYGDQRGVGLLGRHAMKEPFNMEGVYTR